jgi:hypothetical protein
MECFFLEICAPFGFGKNDLSSPGNYDSNAETSMKVRKSAFHHPHCLECLLLYQAGFFVVI